MAYYEGEISPMCYGGNNNSNNGFGDWSWIVGLAIIGALFGGFGGNGFGNRGGFGGGFGGDFAGWQLGRLATTNDVASGFSTSEIMSDLNDIILQTSQGFANVQQTLCQGFSGINSAIANTTSTLGYNMLQGFNGIENALCTVGYQQQAGFNSLANQIASCCCDLKTMNLENRYLNEKQTCDIVAASNANTRAILDYLTNEKIEGLRAENVALKGQISNDRQSQYIVSQLREPCPVPAYVVQPPQQVTFATNCCGNTAYAGYGSCGASVQ